MNQIMGMHSFSTVGLHAVDIAKAQMHCFRGNSTELASLAPFQHNLALFKAIPEMHEFISLF